MRILVIHQHFLAPGQPGGSRFNEMARLWAGEGHHVNVIAGTLNYATGRVPSKYEGRWITEEADGAVRIWRCHVPRSYSASTLGRMWAFLAFTISAACAALRVGLPDVVIASSPPLIAVLPAFLVAVLRGRRVPWVFEVRDLWPESAVTTGVLREGSWLTRALYLLEAWACRHADRINVLTPAFRDEIVRRGLARPEKVVMVPNGADVDSFRPGPRENDVRRELGWGSRFVLMYAGAHGRANAVGQLVDAAEKLRDRPDILIACVGDGPERPRWEAEARARGLSNIVFYGPRPKERMPDFVNACDAGLAVLQRNPTFLTVYPNKMFDYMSCARPTLLAVDGVARRLLCEEAQAGTFAEPENPASIAAVARRLADDPEGRSAMGRRGREWVLAHAARDVLARRYLSVLESLKKGPPPGKRTARVEPSFASGLKHLLDRAAAGAALVVLSPVIGTIALLIRTRMGSPVFFRQVRPGLRGQPFRLVKFRTMRDGAEDDELRLTRLGRFLRATSLDELPELSNVWRGDMSLVGPRPLLTRYLARYTAEQSRRHLTRPGITGWAQVNGRNRVPWEERLRLDTWYVDHASLWLDFKILLMTGWLVLRGVGVTAPGSSTMPEFLGSSGSEATERPA